MTQWRCQRTGRIVAVAFAANGGWIAVRYDKFSEWHSRRELAEASIDRSFEQQRRIP
jgi:hypothetical protein